MVFPEDVQTMSNNASKLSLGDKTRVIFWGIILGNAFLLLFLIPLLGTMGVSWWYPVVVLVAVETFIGVYVVRIFVFKEDEKIQEYNDRMTDSFLKFYALRNVDADETLKIRGTNVPIYEYNNGSIKAVFRFRFGANDDARKMNNVRVFQEIYRIAGENNLEIRQYTSKEEFSKSPEAILYRKKISAIKDRQLGKTMVDIFQNLLDTSDQLSNVDVVNIIIRTKYNYQKYTLGEVVDKILNTISNYATSFRSVDVLYKKSLLELYKDFYGLEVIDPGLMKVRHRVEADYNKYVEVYQFIDSNGKVLINKTVVDKTIETARKIRL